jgi:hypothetical protein
MAFVLVHFALPSQDRTVTLLGPNAVSLPKE